MMIIAIISIVPSSDAVGLFVTRGGSNQMVGGEVDWSQAVPSMDAQANSMYGGTDVLFQQSYANCSDTSATTHCAATTSLILNKSTLNRLK